MALNDPTTLGAGGCSGLRNVLNLAPTENSAEWGREMFSAMGNYWWRLINGIEYGITLARLSIIDRLIGPEPPTAEDKIRERDMELLRKAFPRTLDR
jgi:hypothetical protein